jgi:phosphoglycolate phosphatase
MTLNLTGETIVFDLDGTLVDTAPDLAAATNHVLGLAGVEPVSIAQLHRFIGHGSKAMIDAGLRLRGATLSEPELARLHDQFLAYYADNVAVHSRPFEGISELIDTLLAAGARLAVCTNKVEGLSRLLLRELALDAKFGAVAGGDTYPMRKPEAGHLTRVIDAAGGRVARAVMVGDSEVDFATAQAAGVPAIGVTFGYTPTPVREMVEFAPAVIIDHYREFLPALRQVLRPR